MDHEEERITQIKRPLITWLDIEVKTKKKQRKGEMTVGVSMHPNHENKETQPVP